MTQPKKAKSKKQIKASANKRISAIEKEIILLKEEKAELVKVITVKAVHIPLHQLNLISSIGYDSAKQKMGDNWVSDE
jgi:hypothetical protein